jgi:hypothetical protein
VKIDIHVKLGDVCIYVRIFILQLIYGRVFGQTNLMFMMRQSVKKMFGIEKTFYFFLNFFFFNKRVIF